MSGLCLHQVPFCNVQRCDVLSRPTPYGRSLQRRLNGVHAQRTLRTFDHLSWLEEHEQDKCGHACSACTYPVPVQEGSW